MKICFQGADAWRAALFRSISLLPVLSVAAWSHAALADSDSPEVFDPVVVTATRSETPESHQGDTTTVITAEEIASRGLNSVVEVLRVVPGLDVVQSGGAGQQATVFMRGAASGQTLVMIDYTEMNDPSNPTGGFDFANLQVDNIERIEILRGAESGMYGSDAMGGVIHIITKKGDGKPKVSAFAQGGNYNEYKVGGGISGSTDRAHYSLNASHFNLQGVSAADHAMGNTERDGYRNTTVDSRAGYQLTEQLDADWTLRYNDAFVSQDDCAGYEQWGMRCDDPNNYGSTSELYTRGQGHMKLMDGFWEQRAGVGYSQTDRNFSNDPDPEHLGSWDYNRSHYTGEKLKAEWLNMLNFSRDHVFTLGLENETNRMQSQSVMSLDAPEEGSVASMNDAAVYGQEQISFFENAYTTGSFRYDNNNRFGGHVTGRLSQVYLIPLTNTRIKGNYGTGWKTPSLTEAFDPFYGNPDLKPEGSYNWDVGVEQGITRDAKMGLTYFNNRFQNLIVWASDPNNPPYYGKLENVASATAQGLESFVEWKPMERLNLRANYTLDVTHAYGVTPGQDDGQALWRRPLNKGSFDADYHFTDAISSHLNILVVGQKSDVNDKTVPGYALVNLATHYDVSKELQLYMRLDNLLNKQYEQLWGYGNLGFNGMGGFRLTY